MKTMILALTLGLFSACKGLYSEKFQLASSEDLIAPANIAVLPCLVWPTKHGFSTSGTAVFDTGQMAQACKLFDSFILTSFSGQPFMKGKTPRLVQKALETAGKPGLLGELPGLIAGNRNCEDCEGPLSFYRTVLYQDKFFMGWLTEFKKASPSSDAILIPIVFDHLELRDQDRGLDRALRSSKVSILLIRTYNASIQWYGTRHGFTSSVFGSPSEFKWPEWTLVYEQVFIDSLWKDFPGYQIYRD
jgi:hypothetical protein